MSGKVKRTFYPVAPLEHPLQLGHAGSAYALLQVYIKGRVAVRLGLVHQQGLILHQAPACGVHPCQSMSQDDAHMCPLIWLLRSTSSGQNLPPGVDNLKVDFTSS